LKLQIFNGRNGQNGQLRLLVKFRGNGSISGRDVAMSRFFHYGGRPPSWICDACVGSTHEWHLAVFITLQNLVEMDAVVLIIYTLFDFASLA